MGSFSFAQYIYCRRPQTPLCGFFSLAKGTPMAKVDAQEKPKRLSRPFLTSETSNARGQERDSPVYEPISGAGAVESLQSILGNELVL